MHRRPQLVLVEWLSPVELEAWVKEGLTVVRTARWLTHWDPDSNFVIVSQTIFDQDVADSVKIPTSAINWISLVANEHPPVSKFLLSVNFSAVLDWLSTGTQESLLDWIDGGKDG